MPYYVDQICMANHYAPQPSSIHLANNLMYDYYRRQLLRKAISVFKYEGIPEYWNRSLLLYSLFGDGKVAVFDTDEYGVIIAPCNISGMDVMFKPTTATIFNSILPSKYAELRIDKECVVVHVMPDYAGALDIVNLYAREMAVAAETFEINLYNSRVSFIGSVHGADRKRNAATIKEGMDKLYRGEPIVVMDSEVVKPGGKPAIELLSSDIGRNFIAPQCRDILRRLEAEFAAAVGLPADLSQQKKERTNTEEVSANNIEVAAPAALWLDTLNEGFSRVNDMYDISIKVSWRYKPNVRHYQPDEHGESIKP